ncbi:AAA family ATPase [Sinorhizobium medicae]|uniref:AAA family ATPase n=1 Tax=Rhizobium meliloti TaxID=382 RepID=A0AAW9TL61_RHIML|nr:MULTISPECIES: AAA family ATPase [Sinorhizobium]MDX0414794.1 AAA family ATPase [Sinorhizobium medicae]MDX0469425.1 AAA family ATPase [Sinorhizobium medicae]MDX0475748.1 AAA family ATPase [Sinorhizobium medicae]MDX0900930.1 AAA family ATPase [Sinorhizobium medicae]MDX1176541.1 AAA family ATPase [Sinorhizobium medicae]
MRVDKLTIGSPKQSASHHFKNLKNVTIDFAQSEWVTVVIGWNGTGKSNVLEALAIIFRELIGPRRPPKIEFAFELIYRIGKGDAQRFITIVHDPDEKQAYTITVRAKPPGEPDASPVPSRLRLSAFLQDGANLPRYVFCYYSGESPRMNGVFSPYLQWYDERLRRGQDPGLKRLFYALPVHSQFVLLAFMIGGADASLDLLRDHLGLDPDEGLESVLFVLRQPPWPPQADGDPRFWGARGVVSGFLHRLQEVALAPISVQRRVPTSLWNEKTLEFKYLFVKDIASLRRLVGDQTAPEFFRDLESTHVSQLIEEVRIKVRLRGQDGTVTFRELSEGEQQLLTVLGLLRFTAEDESLILLDEPDTHLNPKWSVEYLDFLRKFIGGSSHEQESSHVIMTTHNPIAIAELSRDQVQILQTRREADRRDVVAVFPDMDPRGMGYASIVTSDMFGIASPLDKSTQYDLEIQRNLSAKDRLNGEEQAQLDGVNARLDKLGFRFLYPDDEYSRYIKLRSETLQEIFGVKNADRLATHVVEMSLEERDQLAKRLIAQLVQQEQDPLD